MLAALVVRWEPLAVVAAAILGGAYTAALFAHGSELDAWAPLYAGALVLVPELVAGSNQSRLRMEVELGARVLRLAALAAVLAVSVGIAAAVVAAAATETSGGLVWEAAGVAAAIAALALVAFSGRRRVR